MAATVTDDGQPTPPAVTYLWATDSGPASASFSSATVEDPSVTFPVAGTYVLRLTANDGALSATDTVQVTVNPAGGGGTPQTFEVRVNANSDDAEQAVTSGSVQLSSSDLELTTDGTTQQVVGVRFGGIQVPQGATITNAYVQFRTDETSPGAANLTIRAENVDNAPTYTAAANNIGNRATTAANVRLDATGLDGGRRGRHRPAHPEPRLGAAGRGRPGRLGPGQRPGAPAPGHRPPDRRGVRGRRQLRTTPPRRVHHRLPAGPPTSRRWSTPVRTRPSPCPPTRPWTAPSPTTASRTRRARDHHLVTDFRSRHRHFRQPQRGRHHRHLLRSRHLRAPADRHRRRPDRTGRGHRHGQPGHAGQHRPGSQRRTRPTDHPARHGHDGRDSDRRRHPPARRTDLPLEHATPDRRPPRSRARPSRTPR